MPYRAMTLMVSSKTVLTGLLGVLGVLMVLHVIFRIILRPRLPNTPLWFNLTNVFNIGSEANVPTLWTTLLLLVAAALFFVIGKDVARQALPFARHWLSLAGIFLLMAVDETAQIHDGIVGVAWQQRFGAGEGILFYAWYIPIAPLVLAVGIAYLRFFFDLPPVFRRVFGLAAGLYLGGALGFELVESVIAHSGRTGLIGYSQLIEESLELAGLSVLIYGLLRWIEGAGIAITIGTRASEEAIR